MIQRALRSRERLIGVTWIYISPGLGEKSDLPNREPQTAELHLHRLQASLPLHKTKLNVRVNMEEPPAKRAKRIDSAAMWDRRDTASPRPHNQARDGKNRSHGDDSRDGGQTSKRDDDRRRRSRSHDRPERRRERDRSRSRDRTYRDRGARDREVNGHSRRERSRSRDRYRSSRGRKDTAKVAERYSPAIDYHSTRPEQSRQSRSRSPIRNGGGGTPVRTRSPARLPRSDHNRSRPHDRNKIENEEKASRATPDTNDAAIAIDDDDDDAVLRKLMGFTTFKSTQNTKVPGNQIYGVRKEKKIQYRQYMNRVGGFNRPLSPTRS